MKTCIKVDNNLLSKTSAEIGRNDNAADGKLLSSDAQM